ncbi:peptidyl-prolyl cis-trans isomerase [Aureococcus anophagefferens]|nr:peptidyl-prolyl cis-trans isomerase [Aureococcus anophagefferens]
MVKKDKGGTFAVDGILYKEAKMEMILGGYTTPLTSGNFLDLVSKGFYNGMAIQRADGFVAPTYGETTEDGQRGSAQTVLPFQAYGALGMARDEYEADSASSQFFFLLFDSDLTPAGKNLLDGRYSCFGYTIAGSDFLGAVEEATSSSVKIPSAAALRRLQGARPRARA